MLFPKASKKGWLLIKQPGLVHTVKKTKSAEAGDSESRSVGFEPTTSGFRELN